ncbi:MAG: hypothetical protein DMD74_05980 [Gemmatimonadetes bacterium]|nr:MAG: hypothetical protein DMD74_05980 [Gemmatimonadota bacterium]
MSFRVLAVCVASALPLARPAAAQRTGTIEIGGFARFTDFDNSLNISNSLGVGGRIGVFLLPRVSVEAELATTSTDSGPSLSVKHTPFHLFGVYNHPADPRADIVIGVGYVHNKYSDGVSSTDNGVAGLVGVRYRIRDLLALRIPIPHPPSRHTVGPLHTGLISRLRCSANCWARLSCAS